MNKTFRLVLYVVLTVASCVFGYLTYTSYTRLMGGVMESSQDPRSEAPALDTGGATFATKGYANVMIFGAFFFVSVLALGFLLGHDVAHHLGDRVLRGVHNDEGEGMADPEYEAAEQVWADGQHLEAIQLMRDYLKKNPREQHAAIRIAEIYEKDLNNNLAAALEYEEILKQKLPAERWGWAAIHLCNLYFRMNQSDKAVALLRRIDVEYGETAAAGKARKRLELIDAEGVEASSAEAAPASEIAEEPGPGNKEAGS